MRQEIFENCWERGVVELGAGQGGPYAQRPRVGSELRADLAEVRLVQPLTEIGCDRIPLSGRQLGKCIETDFMLVREFFPHLFLGHDQRRRVCDRAAFLGAGRRALVRHDMQTNGIHQLQSNLASPTGP